MADAQNDLDRELLLVAIQRTYDWKLCRMVMLLRMLRSRRELVPRILPSEYWNDDDNLLRDGLMLDVSQTCWEIAEALTAVAHRLLAGETSVVKSLVEYETNESWGFIRNWAKLTDGDLRRLFKQAASATELQTGKNCLALVEKFMISSHSATMKAKHGGVTLIGWDQPRDESPAPSSFMNERARFMSIVDYDKAKIILKDTSVSELDAVGNAIWWLYDHMINSRAPREGVRIKAHRARG